MQPLDEIYRQYASTVYRYLLSQTRNPDLAEELTQETFFQAVRSIDRFDESCRVSTWLCAIAKNVLLTYRRKHPPAENIDDLSLPSESAEEKFLSAENKVELFRMLHGLEDPYREVIYLRVFGNLSFKEIGDILQKTENWARVTYYRGKEKLKNARG